MELATLIPGPDGWWFAPEGAALQLAQRTAVIADVHLGYEWARGRGGDCLPMHSLAETLSKLSRLLSGLSLERVVVAGDLVESPALCRRTLADVHCLRDWLGERGVELVVLAGNHDPPHSGTQLETIEVAGWAIGHGFHPLVAPQKITGHLHPVIRAGGLSAPCFLVGPRRIILPAFSDNAAGVTLLSGLFAEAARDRSLRCLATAGERLLDFGLLHELRRSLRARNAVGSHARRRRSH
jgi:putative SbcD/Mre11-related phosphoesterase